MGVQRGEFIYFYESAATLSERCRIAGRIQPNDVGIVYCGMYFGIGWQRFPWPGRMEAVSKADAASLKGSVLPIVLVAVGTGGGNVLTAYLTGGGAQFLSFPGSPGKYHGMFNAVLLAFAKGKDQYLRKDRYFDWRVRHRADQYLNLLKSAAEACNSWGGGFILRKRCLQLLLDFS